MPEPIVDRSPVALNEELNKAIQAALSPEAILQAVVAEAEKQGLDAAAAKAAADKAIADRKIADEAAAKVAPSFNRTVAIAGREFLFEAPTELELERLITNAYQVAYAVKEPVVEREPVHEVQPDPAEVAKAAELQAAARAQLELDFRSGKVTAADYIEKSGAMEEYLSSKGIPLDQLKDAVDQHTNSKAATASEQSWAAATQEFLAGVGSDWPGGDKNRDLLGTYLLAMGLDEAPDKVAALTQAFDAMKTSGMIFPNEEVVANNATADAAAKAVADQAAADKAAADAAAIAEATRIRMSAAPAIPARTASNSSSLFDRSSGVLAQPIVAVKPGGPAVTLPDNASPVEIMEAWKQSQLSAGKDPNAAMMEQFAHRR